MTGIELAVTEYAATVFQAVATVFVVGLAAVFGFLLIRGSLGR